jgi:thiol-disulfide isomerase/thioredoxin
MKKIVFLLFLAAAIAAFSCKPPQSASLPTVELKDLNGKPIQLSSFQGKPLVINFWATWCGPCRMEIPMINDLHKKFSKNELVILGVSTDEDGPSAVTSFMKEVPILYPVYMGDDGVADKFGGVWALPTTYFFDRQGNKVDQIVGLQTRDYWENRIHKIL